MWADVGNYMRRAILDVAHDHGTPEIVDEIKPLVMDMSEALPLQALLYTQEHYPGLNLLVMDRADEIQRKHHREDWRRMATFRQPRPTAELLTDALPGEKRGRLRTIFRSKK